MTTILNGKSIVLGVTGSIAAFKAAGVTHLQINPMGENPLEIVEKVKAWSE